MENNSNKIWEFNTDWIVTLLLCVFLWGLWVHRFYNWKIGTWILMLLTFWGFWIWWTIDLIIVVVWKFTNKDGVLIAIKN